MAPLIKELAGVPTIDCQVCTTGQHDEMLEAVLRLYNIKPDYNLKIMEHGQTITEITCAVLTGLEEVIRELSPQLVLVHGDTSTSAAAALAAFYQRVRVGHVEAGLRSGNIYSPFPEEMNRRLCGSIASFHFAPTEQNRANLLAEGVPEEKIFVTGNTVIEALKAAAAEKFSFAGSELSTVDFTRPTVLLTCHRRENWGAPMAEILTAIRTIALLKPEINIVFSVHPNPTIRQLANELLGGIANIKLVKPLAYLPFVQLMKRSTLILTDSGGIQEEGPALGKPVLVLRSDTERPEAVQAGTSKLVGNTHANIVRETIRLLEDKNEYHRMVSTVNPYGDGRASSRIAKIICGITL